MERSTRTLTAIGRVTIPDLFINDPDVILMREALQRGCHSL
jgi:hypothetical protein